MSSFGFNFRKTVGYVTDGANDVHVQCDGGASYAYPQTTSIGGDSIDWGMTTVTTSSSRDRSAAVDVRLAGIWQQANSNAGKSIFRVDLPAAGTYSVTIGAGDASFSKETSFVILDNTTPKITVSAVVTASNIFIDANGDSYTSANWVTSETTVDIAFATTTVFIELGTTTVDTAESAFSHIHFESVATGPALTGPDTTTVDAVRVAAGTALDTATTAGLKIDDDSYSLSLTIDSQTATTLNQTDDIDDGIALGTPVASLPVYVAPADMAAGATAWQIQQWVDDGVNPEVARNITLNYLAAHTSKQAMIAASNTTPGESLLATTIIAVEDDMVYSGPDVVDTVTITYANDGTLTTDKDQTITFNVRYWSPSTGQASYASITVKGSAILGGTGGEGATNLHYVNRTQFYIN